MFSPEIQKLDMFFSENEFRILYQMDHTQINRELGI